MSQLPPPPEHNDAEQHLLGQADNLTGWYIDQLTDLLAAEPGKAFGLAFLRWVLRHFLQPAEAVLRRALHILAARLPAPAAPTPKKSAHPRAGGGPDRQAPKTPRAPLFRLTEPQPRTRTNYLPPSQRPRISVPGLTPPEPVKPSTAPDAFEARLRRRVAALSAAWNEPAKAAARLQRLIARGKQRRSILSFVKIPGARASTLNKIAAPILKALNDAAFARALEDTS